VKNTITNFLGTLLLVSVSAGGYSSDVYSVYTEISASDCKLIPVPDELEGGGDELRCSGSGGYDFLVYSGDERVSASIITPDGEVHELQFWNVITRGFSSIGPRAEWRLGRTGKSLSPYALIVRVNAYENPNRPEKITSYLAVVKITDSDVCVTDRIRATGRENMDARIAADASKEKECLAALP
jgi:hypothetical protein